MRGLTVDALRALLDRKAGHQLTALARAHLRRHGMELHKVSGKPQYYIGGTGPPEGQTMTPQQLRELLIRLREEELERR